MPVMGMRIIKTSISVVLCLLIAYWLDYSPPVFACMAAVVFTQGNYKDSVKSGIARTIATIVGCIIAIGIMFIGAENQYLNIALIGIGCAVNIYFCVLIKQPEAAALASIIFISMIVSQTDDTYLFAFVRLAETLSGVVISILVNILIFPIKEKREPNYELMIN